MDRFTGHSEHKVDVKGRLFVPKRVVDGVAEGGERNRFMLTIGPDPCIYLFTLNGFDGHLAQVRRNVAGKPEYPVVMRGVSALSSEQSLDSQGRVLLPETLRKHANLKKDVIVVGVFDHVEIWDSARWEESIAGAAEQAYLEQASAFFLGAPPHPGGES